MYDFNCSYPCPYYAYTPMYNNNMGMCPYLNWYSTPVSYPNFPTECINLKDYGPEPFVVNIEEATKQNNNFRLALWTGCHLQLTLMSIRAGEEIGLEMHPNTDQFLRIEQGQALVQMGKRKDCLDFQRRVCEDYAIFIPAGTWHNVINTGSTPLKLYSIYAPPEHPRGTVQQTKQDAEKHHVC